jgi:short-subunit dehydrogenase
VNTASLAGLMTGSGIYGVTKQAVVALSESLYNELKTAEAPIGVSVLCPGWVNTRIADAERNRPDELANVAAPELTPEREQMLEMVRNFLRSGMDPADIADQVVNGIRDEKLYIITHPQMDFLFKERFDRILARENPVPRMLG